VQIFTAIPKFYGDKSTIRPDRIERFNRALEETGMPRENVLVHSAYVLSVATAERDKWDRAAAGLAKEMERSTMLGVSRVCFHPGSASDANPKAAAQRVAEAMTCALEHAPGNTRLLVENTAGAGRTLGRTAAEVGDILSHIPRELRPRTGYGLDTCHLFSSGYDIRISREHFAGILNEFEDATGEPPAFFHLNDSAGDLGSNRDRHVLLGDGLIGVEPFRWLVQDQRAEGIPLILETPQLNMEPARDDASGDPYDLRMAALLKSFTE
jgi:deoxyribonuclease-4